MQLRRVASALLLALPGASAWAGEVVMVAHPSVPRLDRLTVERIYTGKVVEAGSVRLTPIDLPAGHVLRSRFLVRWVGTDDDRYVAYWTVRRYVGKGVPPIEVTSPAEMLRRINELPGGLGYIDEADLRPGMNVIAR